MATSKATTVDAYVKALPAARRETVSAVRELVNANLPAGYVESMQYGMIGWGIPLAAYPDTYNGQPLGVIALAAQKHHYALYLLGVYGDAKLEAWFRKAYAAAGRKLDMGKSCLRFKSLDALPLDVIGEVVRRVPVAALIAQYEAVKPPAAKAAREKPARKKAAPAKSPAKKRAAK